MFCLLILVFKIHTTVMVALKIAETHSDSNFWRPVIFYYANDNKHIQHIRQIGCLSQFRFTVSCLFWQQINHTLNNGLCYMQLNGNCQLCQSKSNCPSTNLALLNLYLMFSPKLADLLSDCIIFCCYTSYHLCKMENDNYIIKTDYLIG